MVVDERLPVAEVARTFGVTPQTVYKWLRRYRAAGDPGFFWSPRFVHGANPPRAPIQAVFVVRRHPAIADASRAHGPEGPGADATLEDSLCSLRSSGRRWGG
jgi:hypothetical protein